MSEDQAAPTDGPRLSVNANTATPSEQMVKNAIQAETIPLGDGRTISVRKPGVLAQFQLVEALGPELGMNTAYVQMVTPITYLGGIDSGDGEGVTPVATPKTKLQIEGLIAQLGEAGMDALLQWYAVNVMGPMVEQIENAQAAAAAKAALKNG